MAYSLDVLTVKGSPAALGEAQGEHFRDRIRAFVDVRAKAVRAYAAERGAAADALLDIGRASQALYAQWDPEGYEEQCGVARGAGVDSLVLYTFCNMTDMRDAMLLPGPLPERPTHVAPRDPEGCTAALVPGAFTRAGHALVGQTWDLNPTDVEFVVAVHRRPSSGPETWSLTCAGCLTLVGMNEHGLAVGTTNIKVWGSKPGVGYIDILHRAVRCPRLAEASHWVRDAPRAGAHTYWLADERELVEWECAPFAVALRRAELTPLVRANHCLAPTIAPWQGEPTTRSSERRLVRMGELVGAGALDVESLKAAFADRADGVDSINRYPEDAQGTATNGVFIAEPATRQLWACRGPADRGAWVHHRWA